MNKRHYLPIFGLIALLGTAYYLVNTPKQEEPILSSRPKVKEKLKVVEEKLELKNNSADQPSDKVEEAQSFAIVNESLPEWKELLEENLRAQGGDEIEEIKIDKVDSFVWSHEGVSLNVESVVIAIRGRQNQSTKFRAIVDPQNGKILNSWDRPIVEYADPSKRRGIKVDPRYHQE